MTRPYIAQHQPTVFINGFWLDDAQGCEWQITDPKEPLYGFRDREFRTVATGQTLVHGMLDINFRSKGYLTRALQRISTLNWALREEGGTVTDIRTAAGITDDGPLSVRAIMRASEGNDFLEQGIDPTRVSAQGFRDFLAQPFEEFDIRGFTKLSTALREQFWSLTDPNSIEPDTSMLGPGFRAGLFGLPFDMSVVYQSPDPLDREAEQDPALVEILRDCYIVGQSKQIGNNVPGGGRAVVERYQFIAREVE